MNYPDPHWSRVHLVATSAPGEKASAVEDISGWTLHVPGRRPVAIPSRDGAFEALREISERKDLPPSVSLPGMVIEGRDYGDLCENFAVHMHEIFDARGIPRDFDSRDAAFDAHPLEPIRKSAISASPSHGTAFGIRVHAVDAGGLCSAEGASWRITVPGNPRRPSLIAHHPEDLARMITAAWNEDPDQGIRIAALEGACQSRSLNGIVFALSSMLDQTKTTGSALEDLRDAFASGQPSRILRRDAGAAPPSFLSLLPGREGLDEKIRLALEGKADAVSPEEVFDQPTSP
jgi:hypothetical protein